MTEERKIPIGISFTKDILEMVDRERGQLPRSTYVVNALEKQLKAAPGGEK